MFPLRFIDTQAQFIGCCFQKSSADGIDSDDFAEKIMTTDYGVMVMTDGRMIEYSDWTFMYEVCCYNRCKMGQL